MAEVVMLPPQGGIHKNHIHDSVAQFGWLLFKFQGKKQPILYSNGEQSQEGQFDLLNSGSLDDMLELVDEWNGVAWIKDPENNGSAMLFRLRMDVLYPLRHRGGDDLLRLMLRLSEPMPDAGRLFVESNGDAAQGLFVDAFYLLKNPVSPDWLIRKWLTRDSLNCLFGESTAGKSFLAIDWALHVATGLFWQGQKVKPGVVLYICGEGHAGISRRLAAWTQVHGLFPEGRFFVSQRAIVLNAAGAAAVLAEIQRLAVTLSMIIVDTMAWALEGDENSAEDIGAFMRALGEIRRDTKATVIIVHHTGHGDKTRTRGSSALRAGVDAEFSVTRDPQTKIGTLTCTKAKDAVPPEPLSYELQSVDLSEDWQDPEEPGEPVTSLVFALAEPPTANEDRKKEEKLKLSPAEQIALRALETALFTDGQFRDKVLTVIGWQWQTACQQEGISGGDDHAAKVAFYRARDRLIAKQVVRCLDGMYWFADAVRQTAIQIRWTAQHKG